MKSFLMAVATLTVAVAANESKWMDDILAENEVLMAYIKEQEALPMDLRSCAKGVIRDKKDAPDVTFFKRARVRVPRSG